VAEPAGTVTLAGTVRLPLLLESVTANPPAAAAELNVTVQEVLPAPLRLAGVQLKAVRIVGGGVVPVIVMLDPVALLTMAYPLTSEADALEIAIAVVGSGAVGESVSVTWATTPSGITAAFIPKSRQDTVPEPVPQVIDFPALTAVPAAATEMLATSAVEYPIVHSRATAWAPPDEARETLNVTELPGLPLAGAAEMETL